MLYADKFGAFICIPFKVTTCIALTLSDTFLSFASTLAIIFSIFAPISETCVEDSETDVSSSTTTSSPPSCVGVPSDVVVSLSHFYGWDLNKSVSFNIFLYTFNCSSEVLFLLSDQADYINGQEINIDGGLVMK